MYTVDACGGGGSGIKTREKMSLGGKKSVVGSIVQHQVNSEPQEELMWRKQHKAFTLRPQPLEFIAVVDIRIQKQLKKEKEKWWNKPTKPPIKSFRIQTGTKQENKNGGASSLQNEWKWIKQKRNVKRKGFVNLG